MPRLLLLLAALAACTSPPTAAPGAAVTETPVAAVAGAPRAAAPVPAGGFDAQAWLARARAVPTAGINMADDPRLAGVRRVTDELATAVDWNRSCDQIPGADGQLEAVSDPGMGYLRGLYDLVDLGAGQTIVAVLCDFGANTGRYAYVHIDGQRVALLEAPSVGLDGALRQASASRYALPQVTGAGTFTVAQFARGMGGCGTFGSYRVTGIGTAELTEARGISCSDADADASASSDEPSSWPVIYPRP